MKGLLFISLALLASQSSGLSFWNDLRVTWGPLPTIGYNRLPRNLIDATKEGWVKLSEDCANGGEFNGFRYINPSDSGIALLFDVNGYVGGIQSLVPQSELLVEGQGTAFDRIPMYQNHTIGDVTYFVITAYFIDPSKMCEINDSDNGNIGTNSQVWFQNGPDTTSLKSAYKYRSDAIQAGWTINNCIPGMGWHNFWEVAKYEDHNCAEIQPTCLLYNEFDELIGFCLTYPGVATSPYYEHPPREGVELSLGIAPKCLLDQVDQIGATTLHVYFTNTPWSIGC